MIALPSISQKSYIINKVPYVCYTSIENRQLALFLVEGDKNKELIRQDSILINSYKALNVTYKEQLSTISLENSIYKNKMDSLKLKIDKDTEKSIKLAARNKTQKIILGTISTISILGNIIMFLKN